jgi:hypothetical protein
MCKKLIKLDKDTGIGKSKPFENIASDLDRRHDNILNDLREWDRKYKINIK